MELKDIKNLKVRQTIQFKIIDDTYTRRGRKTIQGTVCFKNENYITLQLKNYKESFTYVDFRDRIERVKLC